MDRVSRLRRLSGGSGRAVPRAALPPVRSAEINRAPPARRAGGHRLRGTPRGRFPAGHAAVRARPARPPAADPARCRLPFHGGPTRGHPADGPPRRPRRRGGRLRGDPPPTQPARAALGWAAGCRPTAPAWARRSWHMPTPPSWQRLSPVACRGARPTRSGHPRRCTGSSRRSACMGHGARPRGVGSELCVHGEPRHGGGRPGRRGAPWLLGGCRCSRPTARRRRSARQRWPSPARCGTREGLARGDRHGAGRGRTATRGTVPGFPRGCVGRAARRPAGRVPPRRRDAALAAGLPLPPRDRPARAPTPRRRQPREPRGRRRPFRWQPGRGWLGRLVGGRTSTPPGSP